VCVCVCVCVVCVSVNHTEFGAAVCSCAPFYGNQDATSCDV